MDEQTEKSKVFEYLNSGNLQWLDMTVASLKRNRRRSDRSELTEKAVELL